MIFDHTPLEYRLQEEVCMLNTFFKKLFKNNTSLAILAAITGVSLVDMSPMFVRLSEVGPTATAFFRFFFALPFVWGWMVFDGAKDALARAPRGFQEFFLLVLAGAFLAFDIAFWYRAMIHTSIINAVLLNNFCTVLVAIGGWYFYKDPMSWRLVLAIALALIGSTLLVGSNITLGLNTLKGDLFALASAFFYAGFMLVVKHLRGQFSTPTIMMWGGFSSLYVLAFMAYFMADNFFPQTPMGWGILIVLGVVIHTCGQGLMSYSMGHLTVTFASITTFAGPVVAGLIGWLMFNEHITLYQSLGMVIILAGIILSRRSGPNPIEKKQTGIK